MDAADPRSGKRTAKAALKHRGRTRQRRPDLAEGGGDADRSGLARSVAASDHRSRKPSARFDRDRPAGLARRGVRRDRVLVRRSRRSAEGRRAARSSWCGSRRARKTFTACTPPKAFLTTRGGMTSHAAVVARGMGKPCVSGAVPLRVDYGRQDDDRCRSARCKQGDIVTIDGSTRSGAGSAG